MYNDYTFTGSLQVYRDSDLIVVTFYTKSMVMSSEVIEEAYLGLVFRHQHLIARCKQATRDLTQLELMPCCTCSFQWKFGYPREVPRS